ncbi:MAG: hypothetical protein KGH68_02920 [Patescibacteria group bacterium]|nr:hypothetical protein [Patescibacteria group bacterium]
MKIRHILFGVICLSALFTSSHVWAATASTTDGTFVCSSVIRPGSVKAIVSGPSSAVAGTSVSFSADLMNMSGRPIVAGDLYMQVARRDAHGNYDVVDRFVAMHDISLSAGAVRKIKFQWYVPVYAASGDYKIVPSFVAEGRPYLLGPDLDGSDAGATSFTVNGGLPGTVLIDQSSIKLDGAAYLSSTSTPDVGTSTPAVITASIVNTTGQAATVFVTAEVYRSLVADPASLLRTIPTAVTLAAGQSKTVSFVVSDKIPATLVLIEAGWKDVRSFADVRFLRGGYSYPQIEFVGLSRYPVVAGADVGYFACVSSAAVDSSSSAGQGSVVMKLSDGSGNLIDSYTYTGDLSSPIGIRRAFISNASYADANLAVSVYRGQALTDSLSAAYSCDALDPGECQGTFLSRYGLAIAATLVSLLIAVVAIVLARKRKAKAVITTTIVALAIILSAPSAHAAVDNSPSGAWYAGSPVVESQNFTSYGAGTDVHVDGGYSTDDFGNITGWAGPVNVTIRDGQGNSVAFLQVTGNGGPSGGTASMGSETTKWADYSKMNADFSTSWSLTLPAGQYSVETWYVDTCSTPGCRIHDTTVFPSASTGVSNTQPSSPPPPPPSQNPPSPPTIAGPTNVVSGSVNQYTVSGDAANPSDTVAYDIAFNSDQNPTPDMTVSPLAFSGSNSWIDTAYAQTVSSVSFSKGWNTAGSQTIQARTVDETIKNLYPSFPDKYASGWNSYTVAVTNPPPLPQQSAITVQTTGTGVGTVTSSPSGIDCSSNGGGSCSMTVMNGTSVTLSASASSGSTFTGWNGPCSGTGSCKVTANGPTSVVATFDAQQPVAPDAISTTLSVSNTNVAAGDSVVATGIAYGSGVRYFGLEGRYQPAGGSYQAWQNLGIWCQDDSSCPTSIPKTQNPQFADSGTYELRTYAAGADRVASYSNSVFVTVSSAAPAAPSCVLSQGQPCASAGNSCGMTNTGTIQCDGSCSAGAPSDSLCSGGAGAPGNNGGNGPGNAGSNPSPSFGISVDPTSLQVKSLAGYAGIAVQDVNVSVNPVAGFSAPVLVEVDPSSFPASLKPEFSFAGADFKTATSDPSGTLTFDGTYYRNGGIIYLPVRIRFDGDLKQCTNSSCSITFKATAEPGGAGTGETATATVNIDSKPLYPGFNEI